MRAHKVTACNKVVQSSMCEQMDQRRLDALGCGRALSIILCKGMIEGCWVCDGISNFITTMKWRLNGANMQ